MRINWSLSHLCSVAFLMMSMLAARPMAGETADPPARADRLDRIAQALAEACPGQQLDTGFVEFLGDVWTHVDTGGQASDEFFAWYLDSLPAMVKLRDMAGDPATGFSDDARREMKSALKNAHSSGMTQAETLRRAAEIDAFMAYARIRLDSHYDGRRVALYKPRQDKCLLELCDKLHATLGEDPNYQLALDMMLSPLLYGSMNEVYHHHMLLSEWDPTNVFVAGMLYARTVSDHEAMETLEQTLSIDDPIVIRSAVSNSMSMKHIARVDAAKRGWRGTDSGEQLPYDPAEASDYIVFTYRSPRQKPTTSSGLIRLAPARQPHPDLSRPEELGAQ